MEIGITNYEGGEQEWLRPAVPASRPTAPTESKRTSVLEHRTFAPNGFGRRKAPSGEGGKGDIEIAKEDENFRNGLKRNIVHLSNLTRVNQEQLARLREQLKAKDNEIASLKALKENIRQEDRQQDPSEQGPGPSERTNAGKCGPRKLITYGKMVVTAGRLASEPRQRPEKAAAQPSEQETLETERAVAAMGAKHTEQQLLRASRDVRGQLERALQEAEALRADNIAFKTRVNLAEKEKAHLETRVALLSDEVKLQIAPLKALQLELTQTRSDTETMRQRLKEERRESRLRLSDSDKAKSEAQKQIELLEFDLNETAKACQRESLKASTFEGMYQEASTMATLLQAEVEQCRTDAKIIAQELTRMQIESEKSSALVSLTPSLALSSSVDIGRAVGGVEGEEVTKEKLREEQEAEIASLKKTIAQLESEESESGDAMKNFLEAHRREVEERERAFKEMQKKADFFAEENSGLRATIEKQEAESERQRVEEDERHDRDIKREIILSQQNLDSASLRDRLCRTLDELCGAEEAGELMLTCQRCAKLFKNPHTMAPCGHTLCAGCCAGGDGGMSAEDGSARMPGGSGESPGSVTHAELECYVCGQQDRGAADRVACVGMAPNRALASVVVKFAFRRQLVQTLKETGAALSG
ncbi:unnamed protein product [Ectocarpus sp. 12 AP-2014]